MSFTGMDIAAVRTLATQFETKAGEIDNLRTQLTTQLDGTAWVGADRERFHSDWMGQYTTSLNQVADALRDACTRARMNADQQETASQ